MLANTAGQHTAYGLADIRPHLFLPMVAMIPRCLGRSFSPQKPACGDRISALYLRSVCLITTASHGLTCHPLTCMLLKVRLSVDSSISTAGFFATAQSKSQ